MRTYVGAYDQGESGGDSGKASTGAAPRLLQYATRIDTPPPINVYSVYLNMMYTVF